MPWFSASTYRCSTRGRCSTLRRNGGDALPAPPLQSLTRPRNPSCSDRQAQFERKKQSSIEDAGASLTKGRRDHPCSDTLLSHARGYHPARGATLIKGRRNHPCRATLCAVMRRDHSSGRTLTTEFWANHPRGGARFIKARCDHPCSRITCDNTLARRNFRRPIPKHVRDNRVPLGPQPTIRHYPPLHLSSLLEVHQVKQHGIQRNQVSQGFFH